ncbi:ATP-binding protein [Achromobacter aloeverae]|uniref:ATP-binding protein n=1 Tax=Achromobacter aloeverae TaxID=1750518 RepID=UPI0030841D21
MRVEQIAWNLINNGIKFTPPGGSVTIGLAQDERMARLVVTDTGEGIEPDFLPRLFEMYSQGKTQDGPQKRMGLGIGLAVVNQLIQAHGGHVHVTSEGKGKGASFTVWLPLAAHVYGPASQDADEETGGQLEGIRILLVDDSPELLDAFGELLSMEGARVQTASSGELGLEALAEGIFDIVISDIGMPEMDGYAFIAAMRAVGHSMPAIALTGFGAKKDIDQAKSAGFAAHVGKPAPLDQMISIIQNILRGNEVMQAEASESRDPAKDGEPKP